MNTLCIRGGIPLAGEIPISGSKNAVLPMMAASVAFREPCCIQNCPRLTDVEAAVEILTHLGAEVRRREGTLWIDPRPICRWEIPRSMMGKMRGSVFFAGPLMARFGRCRLTEPGGCPLGERPVDFHRRGLEALGARADGDPDCYAGPLMGGNVTLPYPSVGATENLILAALGAREQTTIGNAAREPEIVCLCDFLRRAGCRIRGDGGSTITVQPGLPVGGTGRVIPDRMETATFACAVAAAGGEIRLTGTEHRHLEPVLAALERAGCRIRRGPDWLEIQAEGLTGAGEIVTGPYPAFPTDAQAVVMAALTRSSGQTTIRETVFSRRMGHVEELRKMGANIPLDGNTARVIGVPRLWGAEVTAGDLRGGAALAIAALAAEGETRIAGVHHIMRGYERFPEKLQQLGAWVAAG